MMIYLLIVATCLLTIDAQALGRSTVADRFDVLLTTGPFRDWLSYRFPPDSNDEMIDIITLRNQLRLLQLEHGYDPQIFGNKDVNGAGNGERDPTKVIEFLDDAKTRRILVNGIEMAVCILDSTGAVHIVMVVPIINGNLPQRRDLPLCSTGFRVIDRALRDVFPHNLNSQTGPIVLSGLSETRYPVYFVLCREGFLERTLRWFVRVPYKIVNVSPPSIEILMDS
jgi:hypothetical protein